MTLARRTSAGSVRRLAALAGVVLCGAVQAQTYEPVADWLKVPAGRETLGPMHGDIAVSRAGEVYVSVETEAWACRSSRPTGAIFAASTRRPRICTAS